MNISEMGLSNRSEMNLVANCIAYGAEVNGGVELVLKRLKLSRVIAVQPKCQSHDRMHGQKQRGSLKHIR